MKKPLVNGIYTTFTKSWLIVELSMKIKIKEITNSRINLIDLLIPSGEFDLSFL